MCYPNYKKAVKLRVEISQHTNVWYLRVEHTEGATRLSSIPDVRSVLLNDCPFFPVLYINRDFVR